MHTTKLLSEGVFETKQGKASITYERLYDPVAKDVIIREAKLQPSLYEYTNSKTKFKDILSGKHVKKVEFDNVFKYYKYKKENKNKYTGDFAPKYQHMRDNYYFNGLMNEKPKKWFLDIETRSGRIYPDEHPLRCIQPPSEDEIERTSDEAQELNSTVLDEESGKWVKYSESCYAKDRTRGGFPYPINAEFAITLFQIYDDDLDIMYVLGTKDANINEKKYDCKVKYINCKDEVKLINTFVALMQKLKPAIISAWNGEMFDYPYIWNRMNVLGMGGDKLSPVGSTSSREIVQGKKTNIRVKWDGIFLADEMELYKKFTFTPRASYSLSNIGSAEIGADKINYSEFDSIDEFYRKDYDKFVDYGIQDVILLRDIDRKINLLNLVVMIANMMCINYEDALGTVKPWSNYINAKAMEMGLILPNDSGFDGDPSVLGAWVDIPVKGKHNWFVSFDWASLYPSIMRYLNMSAETYVDPKVLPKELLDIQKECADYIESEKVVFGMDFNKEVNIPEIKDNLRRLNQEATDRHQRSRELLDEYNLCMAPNGAMFKRDTAGIIPTLVDEMYGNRKKAKKSMFKHTQRIEYLKALDGDHEEEIRKEKDLEAYYDCLQMTLKILMNSLYGALGNKYFVLFNEAVANGITSTGRYANQRAAYELDRFVKTKFNASNALIYGDTDSFYMTIQDIVYKKFKATEDPLVYIRLKDNKEVSRDMVVTFCDNVCEKILQPVINKTTDDISTELNALRLDVMEMDREVIGDKGFLIAKKRYVIRVLDNEGVRLSTPKIKKMGVDMVRSSTPVFSKKYLEESIPIILDKTEADLHSWLKGVQDKFYEAPIEDIARTSGVKALDFDWNGEKYTKLVETTDKERLRNGKQHKYQTAPVNTTAGQNHNWYINHNNITDEFSDIEQDTKMKYVYVRQPNYCARGLSVFGFQNPKLMKREDIVDVLDMQTMWDKFFISPLDLMVNAIGWKAETKTFETTDDEW